MALKNLSELDYTSLEERLKNGIETGFIQLDKHIHDLKHGEISVLFGRDGEGKSTVASQIIAHHINRGKKAYLFSGELSADKIQDWLYLQIVGNEPNCHKVVQTKYEQITIVKPHIIDMIKAWHNGKLWVHQSEVNENTSKAIFEDIEEGRKIGVDLFVIDNLMTAFEANANTQYADQSNFVQYCKDYAKNNGVHIMIICHPNKTENELKIGDQKGNLTKNDISGSKNISNKADTVIAVERIFYPVGYKKSEMDVDLLLSCLKDRFRSPRVTFKYKFHPKSNRFYNNLTPKHVNYDWRMEGCQNTAPF